MSDSLLFLTGHLAHDNLCRQLADLDSVDFRFRVENIGVKVAALMSTAIVSRRLKDISGIDRVILPGLFAGDLESLSEQFGVPFVLGPKDLRDLPEYFGGLSKPVDLTEYTVRIFAEVVDAPHLDIDEILKRAEAFRLDGADVIDVGCLPGVAFDHLFDVVRELKQAGFVVSVDSLDTDDLLTAGKADADYLLSIKESTLWVCEQVTSTPVLIPENTADMSSLYRAMDELQKNDRHFFADAILDPFPFGFTISIVRYHELRSRYPDCQILMGTGNVTELMDADSSGITSVLMSLLVELDITAILTTQVSAHACRAVREADLARRIMHAAQQDNALPRRYHHGLLTTHDKKPFPYSTAEICTMAESIRDGSYRIQVNDDGIHLYNRDGISCSTDPFTLLPSIDVAGDSSHMFYLGVELARAQIAWQLGKRYAQDSELEWGVARRDCHSNFVKLAMNPENTE